jgi:hypothetical protein
MWEVSQKEWKKKKKKTNDASFRCLIAMQDRANLLGGRFSVKLPKGLASRLWEDLVGVSHVLSSFSLQHSTFFL